MSSRLPQPPSTISVTASVTRPADTTAYTGADGITNSTSSPSPITFAGCAKLNGGSGRIVSAMMLDSANQVTALESFLFLFDTAPSAPNDNTQIAFSDSEMATLVACIVFSTNTVQGNFGSGASGNRMFFGGHGPTVPLEPFMNWAFQCGTSSRDLYGVLVATNAYTPVSAEVFTIRLGIQQD